MFSKEQFTTVTPLSKALAMVVFIVLPFAAFFLGMNIGKQTIRPVELIVIPRTENVEEADTSDWQTYKNEEDTVITDNGSTKTFISKFGINVTFPNSWGIMGDTLERYGTLEEAEAVGGNHFALFFDDPETSGPGQTVGGNDIKIEFWPSTSSGKTSSQLSEEAKQEALSFALEFEGTQNNLELSDTELIFNNVDAASYSRNTVFGSRSHIVYIAGEKYDISIVIFGSTDSPHFSEVAGIIDSLAID